MSATKSSTIGLLTLICTVLLAAAACSEDKTTEPSTLFSSRADFYPAWSPDGDLIAYMRDQRVNDSNWVGGLYLYDVNSETRILLWDNYWASSPTWSPNGQWLAFSDGGQIYKMRVNGDSITQLTSWRSNRFCRWSPTGNLIAYDKTAVGLWLCSPDSSNHRLLYDHAGRVSWFSDGFRMAALGLSGELYLIDTLGERYDQITANGEIKYGLSLSPNEDRIVFTQQLEGQRSDLWIIDTDGSNLRRLTTNGGRYPAWSPDGRWIAYTNTEPGNGYLWLMRPDGREKHQITFRVGGRSRVGARDVPQPMRKRADVGICRAQYLFRL
jgi:Tol biopolymer transport system component